MATVQTVNGPIDTGGLGRVLMPLPFGGQRLRRGNG